MTCRVPHKGVLGLVYGSNGSPEVLWLQSCVCRAQVNDRVLRYLQQVPGRRQTCSRRVFKALSGGKVSAVQSGSVGAPLYTSPWSHAMACLLLKRVLPKCNKREERQRSRTAGRCAPLSKRSRRAFQTSLSCRLAFTAAFHAFLCCGHCPSCAV